MRTTAQHLADLILGLPVEAWVADRRAQGARWHSIPSELSDATAGRVVVTERTLRNWLAAVSTAA